MNYGSPIVTNLPFANLGTAVPPGGVVEPVGYFDQMGRL